MKKSKYIVIMLLPVLLLANGIISGKDKPIRDAGVVLDEKFFSEFGEKLPIQRDEYLETLMNRIVIGRGKITSIKEKARYKKKYRVVIESSDSEKHGQKFIFFLFLDNKDTFDLLSVDSRFEFKGQLAGITPLTTKRDQYILDVIMIDGSTVIE